MTKWESLHHQINGAEHCNADSDGPGMLRKLNAALILIARMTARVPREQLPPYLAALRDEALGE